MENIFRWSVRVFKRITTLQLPVHVDIKHMPYISGVYELILPLFQTIQKAIRYEKEGVYGSS